MIILVFVVFQLGLMPDCWLHEMVFVTKMEFHWIVTYAAVKSVVLY